MMPMLNGFTILSKWKWRKQEKRQRLKRNKIKAFSIIWEVFFHLVMMIPRKFRKI